MTKLPKTMPDTVPAASLAAFGGWQEAEWFSPAVLSDSDIVAFALPALSGVRKQNFRIVDRTLAKDPARKAAPATPAKLPRRVAGKLALLLDSAGAVRAVACCRSRLLFESSPVLFFAEFPGSRLKQRAAAKLRREMVGIGISACVLRAAPDVVTLMCWLSTETGITEFIDRAAPEHAIHADFSLGPNNVPTGPARPRTASSGQTRQRESGREAALLQQIAVLQGQVKAMARAQSPLSAMEQLGLDDARLKSMLKLLHPDKHGNSEAANEAAVWLNGLRELLRNNSAS
jgi:hypothetical protein